MGDFLKNFDHLLFQLLVTLVNTYLRKTPLTLFKFLSLDLRPQSLEQYARPSRVEAIGNAGICTGLRHNAINKQISALLSYSTLK